jgi:gamma-glutamylcyclotransferase (GGCT)/AIG2-like uncharacterized protein YtfP
MAIDLLFIYGTLLNSDNEFAIYLQENSSVYSNGKFKGRLYDIGEYPGAVEDTGGKSHVYGSIVLLKDPYVWKHIDHYEDFGANEPQPNLFTRKLIDVETDSGIVNCWVYLYNLPVDGFHLINSGNYLSYKKK